MFVSWFWNVPQFEPGREHKELPQRGGHEEGQEAGSWWPDTQGFPQYARPQEPAPHLH